MSSLLKAPPPRPKDAGPYSVKEAAELIRYWADLNYSPKNMAWYQFKELANKLDPPVVKN